MTDIATIAEFAIEVATDAPRHKLSEAIEVRADELLKGLGVDRSAHIILLPVHTSEDCPALHGKGVATYRFDLCTCTRIRIIVASVSDEVMKMMRSVPGALDKISQPIDENAN